MTLAEEFRQMCATYFPRWREATLWCLEEDAHASWITVQNARHATPDQGSCGPPTRQITMHVSPDNVL